MDTNIIQHMFGCLNNDRHCRQTGDRQKTLLLAPGWNRLFFGINTTASNIPDATLRGLILFNVFSGCDVILSFFSLLKLGWWKVWSENELITATFIKFRWIPNVAEEEDFLNIEKFKFIESFQPLINATKTSPYQMLHRY